MTAASSGERHAIAWWWLLVFQFFVLILPVIVIAIADFPTLENLARHSAADAQAAFILFGFLGLPILIAMSLARHFRRDAHWIKGLWMITGLMGLMALAVFGFASMMRPERGLAVFAWPLTTFMQLVILIFVSFMWWLLRIVSRAA
jgi:hypothetical protein